NSQFRDSRKRGLWPIRLVMGMGSLRSLTTGCASVGSCSPHTEQRDCHSGAGGVVRLRGASIKKRLQFHWG
ncbi:MAG TPA: hypothetical protein VE971_04675, partial [Candidatus Eisenbacteria bacterium]|nr:hypothetical protein [Candidatus Eisenbacteria bacterium]